ncbi:hypothetical protein ACVWYU_003404 [Pseudomonas sp. TE12234]|jgi:hypothetical protein|uniref:Uncharacterized protein n=1 Tax=Pseudomonas moorei TaxID=395599 RepID=A0A1H0YJR0_9PSED|nr:hypothetical protein SAMN04490195_0674 [Pseudomonas moorei]
MLRQLFISGAVAACKTEVSITQPKTMVFEPRWFDECGQYIERSAIHQNSSQLNQVAL